MNNDENNSNKKIWDRLKELRNKNFSLRTIGLVFLTIPIMTTIAFFYLLYKNNWSWIEIDAMPKLILLILSFFISAGALWLCRSHKYKLMCVKFATFLSTMGVSIDITDDVNECMFIILLYFFSAFLALFLFPSFERDIRKEEEQEKNKNSSHNIK